MRTKEALGAFSPSYPHRRPLEALHIPSPDPPRLRLEIFDKLITERKSQELKNGPRGKLSTFFPSRNGNFNLPLRFRSHSLSLLGKIYICDCQCIDFI